MRHKGVFLAVWLPLVALLLLVLAVAVSSDEPQGKYGSNVDDKLDTDGVEAPQWSVTPTVACLSSFTATTDNGSVLLQWQDNYQFYTLCYFLERAPSPDGPWTELNDGLIITLDYLDTSVEEGLTYYYLLVALHVSGTLSIAGPISVTVPTIGEPLPPPLPAGLHRVYLPLSFVPAPQVHSDGFRTLMSIRIN